MKNDTKKSSRQCLKVSHLLPLMILTLCCLFGCQTVKVDRYDLPPVPVRPQTEALKETATTADIYVIMRDLMAYAREWEAWGQTVQDLAGK